MMLMLSLEEGCRLRCLVRRRGRRIVDGLLVAGMVGMEETEGMGGCRRIRLVERMEGDGLRRILDMEGRIGGERSWDNRKWGDG